MNGATAGPELQRIALLGTCVPRRCGIATFTDDLHHALANARPKLSAMTIAMTDGENVYAYPPHVSIGVQTGPPIGAQKGPPFTMAQG
ncbi:hypothetical protein FHS92_003254 [Sphingobium subterraneum]|uniref:Uncharacterized protein n=1 Tax=Sphingobium subterraneum TaxID=627688 RepID=A0A841J574_9SPHN|nr:hypothetical protein [Sphingobium subterraneum]